MGGLQYDHHDWIDGFSMYHFELYIKFFAFWYFWLFLMLSSFTVNKFFNRLLYYRHPQTHQLIRQHHNQRHRLLLLYQLRLKTWNVDKRNLTKRQQNWNAENVTCNVPVVIQVNWLMSINKPVTSWYYFELSHDVGGAGYGPNYQNWLNFPLHPGASDI